MYSEANIVKYLNDRSAPDEPSKNMVKLESQYYFEMGDKQGCHYEDIGYTYMLS